MLELLQLILALGIEKFIGAVIVGFRYEDLGGTTQIAIVRQSGIDEGLRGGDAMLVEHHDQHLGIDERAGVEQFHGIARRLVAVLDC